MSTIKDIEQAMHDIQVQMDDISDDCGNVPKYREYEYNELVNQLEAFRACIAYLKQNTGVR